MAVSAWAPSKLLANLLGGETAGESKGCDYLSNEIKIALAVAALAPDRDTIESYNDLGANEVAAAGGYATGGQVLTTKALIIDAANNRVILDSDDGLWDPSTITARYAIIYNNTPAAAADKIILAVVDFGANASSTDGEFRVAPPTNGWLYGDAL